MALVQSETSLPRPDGLSGRLSRVSIWSDLNGAAHGDGAGYIRRRSGLSYKEFIHDHVRGHRPVILTGVATKWPALTRWTPDFLKERFGAIDVRVDGVRQALGAFVDDMKASRFDRPGRYAHPISIPRALPSLLEDINPHPNYWYPNWLDSRFVKPIVSDHQPPNIADLAISMGGAGSASPLIRHDALQTETFTVQIHGRTEWVLYSRDQTPCMYPATPVSPHSQLPVKGGVDLERFPKFRDVRPVRFFIEPGEMFYNPPGWWHTTRALTPSIALVLTIARGPIWWGVTKSTCTRTLYTDERSRPVVYAKTAAIFAYMAAFGAVRSTLDAFSRR